ncbi:MAG TPA: general secretion pathway protein GspK [Deltaproteobacteria bacterium]|nr:general secretion pathway protein GspK [Deltaproteobacteria bacterium]
MKMFNRILPDNKGIALITVILIVSVLVALVIELNRSLRADIYDAANISDGIKLTYIAKSGFYGAAVLLGESDKEYETLRDEWANMEALSMQSSQLFDAGYFIVRVEDEAGKIPLNKLVEGNEYNPVVRDILQRLLRQPEFGLDEGQVNEIVDSIKDWIDEDSAVTGSGAESLYYSTLDPPYEAKNAPLDCIEELLMIKGITREIFNGTMEKPGMSAYVTTDSGEGAININTAPVMVLRALSEAITPEVAKKMDEYRRGADNDLSSWQWYKEFTGVDIPAPLTVSSNYFKIYSTGKMNEMEQTINANVIRDGKSIKIAKWRVD